jgi:hypothetical protein
MTLNNLNLPKAVFIQFINIWGVTGLPTCHCSRIFLVRLLSYIYPYPYTSLIQTDDEIGKSIY